MAAAEPLPTLEEMLDAFAGAVSARRRVADLEEGSLYDLAAGVGALLWMRQAARDQDEFRNIYFRTAREEHFDRYIARKFPGKERTLASAGTGYALLSRPASTAGGGSFLDGTRILVGGGTSRGPSTYVIQGTQPVPAGDLTARVLISATVAGAAGQVDALRGDVPILRIEDPLWDNTWRVDRLVCGSGTELESVDAARARITRARIDERNGFNRAIVDRMKLAGASRVVMFRSDANGATEDVGLNMVYVGDDNWQTSAALLLACRLAMPGVAVAGTSVQVLPMGSVDLDVDVLVRLWRPPAQLDQVTAQRSAQAAVEEYFVARENPFLWNKSGISGSVARAVRGVQGVDVTASLAEPVPALVHTAGTLVRFRLAHVNAQIAGPQ